MLMMACGKDNAQPNSQNHSANHDSLSIHQADPRDSLVGTYSCINHHSFQGSSSIIDTIIGPATILVSKFSSDTTCLVINNDTLHFYTNTYVGPGPGGNPRTAKFFPGPSEGINFVYEDNGGLSYTDYYYYVGHKN